jgi:hypothetical protein
MSSELILGIIGTIIALSVAITTIWQGVLTRRHNRLSVKPILRIDRNAVKGEYASIILRNNGVGPAIINSVEFMVDGLTIPENVRDPWIEVLNRIGLSDTSIRIQTIISKESFSAGEKFELYKTINPVTEGKEINKIRTAVDRLTILIEYESVYEEQFILRNPAINQGT